MNKNKIKMYCYTFKDGLSSYKQIMFTKTPDNAHKIIKVVETEMDYEQSESNKTPRKHEGLTRVDSVVSPATI